MPVRPSARRLLALCLLAGSGVVCATPAAAQDPATPRAHGDRVLPGSATTWAAGRKPARRTLGQSATTFRVYLKLRDERGAADYATAVSTPGTGQYKRHLTPAQFRDRYAPTEDQVREVADWLRSRGLTVTHTPPNRKYVEAAGTIAAAESAFSTTVVDVRVAGRELRATTSALSVPARLTSVQAVVGLDDSSALAHPNARRRPGVGVGGAGGAADPAIAAGARDARPCSTYWGEKTVSNTTVSRGTTLPAAPEVFAPCGYTPEQLRSAYAADSMHGAGFRGKHVRIGVLGVSSSPTIAADLDRYAARHGLPLLKPRQLTVVAGRPSGGRPVSDAEAEQWQVEQTLDLEAIRAMAPDSHLTYFASPDNSRGLDVMLNDIVDSRAVDILSNSYTFTGESQPAATMDAIRDVHIQAAAQGMTVVYASGDAGDGTGGSGDPTQASPDWPATSPFVTSVGATSTGIGKTDRREFELAWETGMSGLGPGLWSNPVYVFGSGGGTSRHFAQPDYQRGVVGDATATADGSRKGPMRVVPDAAMVGDPSTGMIVGQTLRWADGSTSYGEYRAGGTSLAAPLYAGMLALVQDATNTRVGFANPALYATRGTSRDVAAPGGEDPRALVRVDHVNGVDHTAGFLYTAWTFGFDEPLSIHAGAGYDAVTGIGTPGGLAWFDAMRGIQRR